jgi:hypothetical protein
MPAMDVLPLLLTQELSSMSSVTLQRMKRKKKCKIESNDMFRYLATETEQCKKNGDLHCTLVAKRIFFQF